MLQNSGSEMVSPLSQLARVCPAALALLPLLSHRLAVPTMLLKCHWHLAASFPAKAAVPFTEPFLSLAVGIMYLNMPPPPHPGCCERGQARGHFPESHVTLLLELGLHTLVRAPHTTWSPCLPLFWMTCSHVTHTLLTC